MAASGGGGEVPEEWEDDGLAMVVSSGGLVAWVPAQARTQDGAEVARDAAVRQDAWVPAEAVERTGWIPSPQDMIVVVDRHGALAVALRHGWVHHSEAVEHGWVPPRNSQENLAAAKVLDVAGLYLPAQEVARGRAVCRHWRYSTQTPHFRVRHQGHRSRRPMPLFLYVDPRPRLPAFSLRAVDIRGRVSRPVLRFNAARSVIIHGSCAGILVLSVDDRLYACNPCTRRWARLPRPFHVAPNAIIGFYAATDGPAGFRCNVLCQDRHDSYWIFTLGSPAPRSIGRPGPFGGLEVFLLDGGVARAYVLPPVLFRDFLHWLPRPSDSGRVDILRFSTVAETFSMIPPPDMSVVDGEYDPVLGYQLFEIDQHLAMTSMHREIATAFVWVRSNIDQVWRRGYIINLPVEITRYGSVFATAQDRNVMVCFRRVLLQCDDTGAELQRYRIAHHFTRPTWHTIEESLLLHRLILPMSDTDAVDGEPPFFQEQ